MANLTGFFVSTAANVNVTITDAHTADTTGIVELGEIQYEFDLTPDQLAISRIAALYSTIDITLPLFTFTGDDIYDRLTNTTSNLVTVTASLHDGTTAIFRFTHKPGDVTVDELARIVKVKCIPYQPTSTVGDIFANANYAGDIMSYTRLDGDAPPVSQDYRAMAAGRFIKNVLSEVTSSTTNVISSTTGLASATQYVFQDFDDADLGGGSVANVNCFVIVDINSTATFANVTLQNSASVLPENVPAFELVKGLAVAEGSIIGNGFENFYRHRLNVDARTLSYSDVTELKFTVGFEALQYIFEESRGRRIGNTGVSRQMPAYSNVNQTASLNPDAFKYVSFILEPAFPFLSVGRVDNVAGIINGDVVNSALTSALVNSGVTAYSKSFPASGNFVVEGKVRGVTKLRPFDAITFDSTVPERYQNKTFRCTFLKFNLYSDEVSFKAYEI